MQGGFYVEGINGVISNERDRLSGKRADDGTWAPFMSYPAGEMKSCPYCSMFGQPEGCSYCEGVLPYPNTIFSHTCAALRFEYGPESRSTVYELPDQAALDACDFSNAILRGDEAAGSPHFDFLIDYDHEKKIYYFASWVGCTNGQKVAVEVGEDYEDNFATCEKMGTDSHSRIKSCDCNHQLRPSTVIDPCHTAFVYGCLRNMPDDLSCCPDPDVVAAGGITYQRSGWSGSYVNATGGSDGVGTCIPKSETALVDNSSIINTANFVDDFGTPHTWTQAKPKIITQAFDALTLMHMGMDPSQIIGTYGERAVEGSNLNVHLGPNAFSGEHFYQNHGDHASSVHDPSLFPTDPTPEEQVMLAQMLDLSPDCSSTNFWCSHFNHTLLDANGWPELIIEGMYHHGYAWTDEFITAAAARNIPIIRLTDRWSNDETPASKSLIEIAQRFEELAHALGVSDVSAATAYDKADLCAEIEAFKPVALEAQMRGVRAMAGNLPVGQASPNGNIGGWLMSPDQDPSLVMLQELGMPIMHTDTTLLHPPNGDHWYEWLVSPAWGPGYNPTDELGMSATNLMSTGGRTGGRVKVPYPVDFWLYDQRNALDFTSDAFAASWPHPALVAGQYARYMNDAHTPSYRAAATMLREVREKLAVAAKVHPEESTCTAVEQSDWEFSDPHGRARRLSRSSINLGPGQYACPRPVSYAMCDAIMSTPTPKVWNHKDSKPDFFPASIPAPMAYYYLGEGAGSKLTDSVSGNTEAGSVLHVEEHQLTPGTEDGSGPQPGAVHSGPNWQADEYFGSSIACGKIDDTIIQKDTLSLADVDYGSTGSWSWSVWFRHEAGVNFPDYQREQFFGHGNPVFPTTSFDQMHIQVSSK